MVLMLQSTLQAVWHVPPTEFSLATSFFSVDAHVAADNAGNAVSVWVEFLDVPDTPPQHQEVIRATSFSSAGVEWGVPTTISVPNADGAQFKERPEVAMDATGTAIAIYDDYVTGDVDAIIFDGNGWNFSTRFTTGAGFTPVIAMDGFGNGLAAWSDFNTGDIFASFYDRGSNSWSAPLLLGTNGTDPTVAYSSSGLAVVAWADFVTNEIVATNFNGVFFTPVISISPLLGDAFSAFPVASIDAAGNAAVIWNNFLFGSVQVANFTGIWNPPVTLSSGGNNAGADLDMNLAGSAAAAWTDGNSNIVSALYNGTSWHFTAIVDASGFDPSVSIDELGNVLVVWASTNNVFSRTYSSFLELWQPIETVTTTGNFPQFPDSAISTGIRAFAVWEQQDNLDLPTFFVYGNFTQTPAGPQNVNAKTCKDRFATEEDCINTITFKPSSTPGVVAYLISREGVLVDTIPADGPFTFEEHNPCCQAATFTITAVDGLGVPSSVITITLP